MSNLLQVSVNLLPHAVRGHIHRIPGVAALQRWLIARFASNMPFIHVIHGGPASSLCFEVTLPLDKAIWAHEKGFYVKNDYYNGINMAFLLNLRASLETAAEPAEAIADFIVAQRVRRRVLDLCQAALNATPAPHGADRFWIQVTIAQAYAGLGDEARAEGLLKEAKGWPGVAEWMIQSTEEQLAKLKGLLEHSPLGRIGASASA